MSLRKKIIVRAPGRINLIGEHTDYNGGLALPMAIDRYIEVTVRPRTDELLVLWSPEFGGINLPLQDLRPAPGTWHTYVQGVCHALLEAGHRLGGFELDAGGNIPVGTGMSSSAALCCATVMALNALFELKLNRHEMALLAQRAEHTFAGVQCGLLDQYACLFAKKGYALKMDFSTLQFDYIRVELPKHSLLLLDSAVKHSLAATEYNLRKQECRRALELVQVRYPRVTAMRNLSVSHLQECVLHEDAVAYKRARFFLEENSRVEQAVAALKARDMAAFGRLLNESHRGLADLYQVSCPEIEKLWRMAAVRDNFLGARLMGGGFGGCTLNLTKMPASGGLASLGKEYAEFSGKDLKHYLLKSADGAQVTGHNAAHQLVVADGPLSGAPAALNPQTT
ncbi:galactokinase [Mucilaginibacter litoreus]|uniref:Galactokinase n=1 Tax=Mucilaginibacter litoreus TaxID=1048221 RepID=A0ABW3AMM8_9SPHI